MPGVKGKSGPPQNLNALKHGLFLRAANGKQLRDRRVRRMVVRMREVMPWLTDADVPGLRTLAGLELSDAEIQFVLKREGRVNADGSPKALVSEQRQIANSKRGYYNDFGMTPAARKVIGLSARQELSLSDYLEANYQAQGASSASGVAQADAGNEPGADGERVAPQNYAARVTERADHADTCESDHEISTDASGQGAAE